MNDPIRTDFILAQAEEGLRLAGASAILSIEPLGPRPCERFVLRFAARSVRLGADGPSEADAVFTVGVWFPSDYLQRVAIPLVLTWLGPANVFHPNISGPLICLGTFRPGTPLVEICFRLYSIISYQHYGLAHPLNFTAAAWARRNLHRFPVDPRPLKSRTVVFKTQVFEKGSAA